MAEEVTPQSASKSWAQTMHGHTSVDAAEIRLAHSDSWAGTGTTQLVERLEREEREDKTLSVHATRSFGAGNRAISEQPDKFRTCFERDRDRILHAASFRRLAGKTQVFVFPQDHQRTRLTHALEVAQVASSVARAIGLNIALTEAIALGHDCGHGPGGHASEDALSVFIDGGYDHAVWGADVTLVPLNLCVETLDGIRNHSWSRVSWADRIAYVCHDFEDAVAAGVVTSEQLPQEVRQACGVRRDQQLRAFIGAMIEATATTGRIAMTSKFADALATFRKFNYENIYMRRESRAQADSVVRLLRALVEHYVVNPKLMYVPFERDLFDAHSAEATKLAVTYVGGMTDRFACRQGVSLLGWQESQLPQGIGI
ncbi:MAG: HD domain-containing protein [Actinobacteria bacterium]|nr:HD domain-containing protein [Actinomycetota bacterium]